MRYLSLHPLSLLNQAYSRPGTSNWNPQADLNQDDMIDAEDVKIPGKNHGT